MTRESDTHVVRQSRMGNHQVLNNSNASSNTMSSVLGMVADHLCHSYKRVQRANKLFCRSSLPQSRERKRIHSHCVQRCSQTMADSIALH